MQNHIGSLEMINITHAVLSQDDVFIILEFEPECPFIPEKYEFDTTVTMIEGKVNVNFII